MHLVVNNPNTFYKVDDADMKAECDTKNVGVFVSNNFKNSFHHNKLHEKVVFHVILLFEIL